MPPKAKFTRNEIINSALHIVKTKGMSALTARELADVLHSSSRPIFTIFKNMEELQGEVIKEIRNVYHEYVEVGLHEELAFRGVGIQYIRFAMEEPELFRLLFMKEQEKVVNLDNILSIIDCDYEAILKSIEDAYGVYGNQSKRLYQHLWIYTYGIAVLSASKVCIFQPDEITSLLTETFLSLLKNAKEENKQ